MPRIGQTGPYAFGLRVEEISCGNTYEVIGNGKVYNLNGQEIDGAYLRVVTLGAKYLERGHDYMFQAGQDISDLGSFDLTNPTVWKILDYW